MKKKSWIHRPQNQRLVQKILRQRPRRIPLKDPPPAPSQSAAEAERSAARRKESEVDYSDLSDWLIMPETNDAGSPETDSSSSAPALSPALYHCTNCGSMGNHLGTCACCGSGSIVVIEPIDHPA